jgi:cell shape-determining protein MreC
MRCILPSFAMLRSSTGRTDPLNVAVVIVVVLALLPTGWLGWVSDVAAIVNAVRTPFGDVAHRVGTWLRAPPDPLAEHSEEIAQLIEDRDVAIAALSAAQRTISQLQEQVRELEGVRRSHDTGAFRPLTANNTGRASNRADGPVWLNVGSGHGVKPGVVAVYNSVHLVGRVAPDVARLTCVLVPLTDPSTGFVDGILEPRGSEAGRSQAPIQLRPTDDGRLIGDVSDEVGVELGDIVRVSDHSWPATAQGMIVGIVESRARKDDAPKRFTVVVRPQFHPSQLRTVTLKLAESDGPEEEGP